MSEDQLFSVAGKVVIVTGGSSGLGARMVRVLAQHGANVVSISRSHASENFCPSGDAVVELIADVTKPAEISAAFDEAEQRFGPVTVLFNSAGIAIRARAMETTSDMLAQTFAVNVHGAFFTAQEAARRMIAHKIGGSIINISSILGETPQIGAAAYAMSKASLSQMTRALALEWAAKHIRVNAIAPGWFPSRINDDLLAGPAEGYLKATNPMRRLGHPEDLDGVVLMLASDASRYMTGSILTVDGGHSL